MAFVPAFLLFMFVGTVLLAGAADFHPRSAAGFMILPALVAAAAIAYFAPTRNFFSRMWFFSG